MRPEPETSRERRILAVAAALVAIVVAGAVADFAVTSGSVPSIPAPCDPPDSLVCNEERNQQFSDRITEAIDLERDFNGRAMLYAFAVIGIVASASALIVPRRDTAGRTEYFRSLGVAGVIWVVAGGIASFAASFDGLVAPSSSAVLAPGVAMLVAAALGGGLSGTRRLPLPSRLGWAGAGMVAVTLALAAVAIAGYDGCESGPRPAWIDPVLFAAAVSAGVGVVFGLVLLANRRWFASLFCIVAGPFCLLIGAAGSACLS